MSQVRFQVYFGPASLRPQRMDRPPAAVLEVGSPTVIGTGAVAAAAIVVSAVPTNGGMGDWYGWRLMGANNRELGRSAFSFVSYQQARRAIVELKEGLGRLVQHSTTDPVSGRWGWRLDLDDMAVAMSSRRYERDHDGRLAAAKFVDLSFEAEMADGVVTLHDRRGASAVRLATGGAA
jgi:hypothetical protein